MILIKERTIQEVIDSVNEEIDDVAYYVRDAYEELKRVCENNSENVEGIRIAINDALDSLNDALEKIDG